MRDAIAQGLNGSTWRYGRLLFMTMSVAVRSRRPNLQDVRVFRQRKLRDRAADLLFLFFQQSGHGELRLVEQWGVRLAVPRHELHCQPTKDVVRDGRRVADFWIFAEAGWLK